MKGSEEMCTEAYHVLPLLKDNLALWKIEEARLESESKEETDQKPLSPNFHVCLKRICFLSFSVTLQNERRATGSE